MTAFGKFDLLVAGDVWVRDFRCWGEERPFSKEHARDAAGSRATGDARDVAIELPRRGAHLRMHGRAASVVDVTTTAILPADDEYLRASPSDAPQASTLVTVSGELAERVSRVKSRVQPVSPATAAAHESLLNADSPLDRHERAIALVLAIARDAGEPSCDAAAHRPPSPAWKGLAARIAYTLATRYAESLTLEAIARSSGASPFHAARAFRAVTGRSIHQQLLLVRVHHALYELSEARGALTAVGLRAGFSSHSHFTSTFRRLMGVAPSELVSRHGCERPPMHPCSIDLE